ncbi:YciI family protein [Agromyces bauzanensis]
MKYLIQIYSNPESRAVWEGFSPEEQAEGYAYYQGISEELASSGELVAGEALADISLAKRVTTTDEGALASDGPFAETKELLAGFYLVDCESEARAIEIAARFPESQFGLIEVRPVLGLSGGDDL